MHLRRYYPPALQVQYYTMLSAISVQGRTHTYVHCNGVDLIITQWYLHLVQISSVSIPNRLKKKPSLSFLSTTYIFSFIMHLDQLIMMLSTVYLAYGNE